MRCRDFIVTVQDGRTLDDQIKLMRRDARYFEQPTAKVDHRDLNKLRESFADIASGKPWSTKRTRHGPCASPPGADVRRIPPSSTAKKLPHFASVHCQPKHRLTGMRGP
jgi:hypothetical protein